MAADTTNQTSWIIEIRREDQTLLISDMNHKITHKFFPEIIKLGL